MTEFEVVLDREASKREADLVQEACEALPGLIARVEATFERKGIGDIPWVVWLMVPVTALVRALAGEAGEDAREVLKSFVQKVYEARSSSGRHGAVAIRDADRAIEVVLDADLPDVAYRKLFDLDLPVTSESGQVRFDRDTGTWRDAWEITPAADPVIVEEPDGGSA